jgi:hypothetical protein
MLDTIMAAAVMLNNATAAELRELLQAIEAHGGDDNDCLLALGIVSRELDLAIEAGE